MIKVIFLDIDGVLNDINTFYKRYHIYQRTKIWVTELEEEYLYNLADIINKTNAKIVLSSSWRIFLIKKNDQIISISPKGEDLLIKLKENHLFLYDMTPRIDNIREHEIKAWLTKNDNISDYVIIDDDIKDLLSLKSHLIKTSFTEGGLNNKNKEKVLNYFNKRNII